MENPTVQLPLPQNPKKRMFAATGSSSNSFGEPDLMEISPPVAWKSKRHKQKSIVDCELIVLDTEDPDDVVIIDEKVAPDAKGKKPMNNYFSGDKLPAKNGAPSVSVKDCMQGFSSSHVSFIDDNFDFGGMDLAEKNYDKECALLQAHFDSIDIPPGVEATVPWWHFSAGKEEQSVTASSPPLFSNQSNSIVETSELNEFQSLGKSKPISVTKSASKNVFHGPNLLYSGLATKQNSYSQTSGVDLVAKNYDKEYELLQALFDSVDIPPGEEATVPRWPFSAGKEEQSVAASSSSVSSKQSNSVIETSEANKFQSLSKPTPISVKKSASKKVFHGPKLLSPGLETKLKNEWSMIHGQAPNFGFHFDPFANFPGWQNASQADASANQFTSNLGGTNLASKHFKGGMVDPHDNAKLANISSQISPPISDEQGNGFENSVVKKLERFKKFDTLEDHSGHLFYNTRESGSQSKGRWYSKIVDEWKMLERDLPDTIFVRVYEARIDLLRAVIVGADGTPYHDGLFFFDVNFPQTYPDTSPSVKYHAHGLRINPNLYACGKVCLSLLGTWSGVGAENWLPGRSTMLQVLLSIQGLILNAEPYYNEPGFGSPNGSKASSQQSKHYSENVFLLSLKTMLCTMRNPPKHFEDLVFGHFYTRAHDILSACRAYLEGAEVGSYDKSQSPSPSLSQSPSPSPAAQLKGSNCSDFLKKNLPAYIKLLVEAFTKIGVKDCENFLVPVEKVVNQSTQGGSSSRRKSKTLTPLVPPHFV